MSLWRLSSSFLANLLKDTDEHGLSSVTFSSCFCSSSFWCSSSFFGFFASSKVCLQEPQLVVPEPEHHQVLHLEALEPDCLFNANRVVPKPDLLVLHQHIDEQDLQRGKGLPLFLSEELQTSSESVRTCWEQQARVHRVEVDSRTLIAFIAPAISKGSRGRSVGNKQFEPKSTFKLGRLSLRLQIRY